MKGKRFYGILIVLVIIGIQSYNLYQQQREERILEFEGYEISAIEDRVDALYNEEKTDIAADISEKELEELDEMLSELEERELRKQNRNRIVDSYVDLLMAQEMYYIQKDVLDLFEEDDIVANGISLSDIDAIQEEVDVYEIKPVYYERNTNRLEDARQQLTNIEEATALVEGLFDEDGNVRLDVTREDEETVLEAINQIKNQEIKQALIDQMETVSVAVEEAETELEMEEDLEEELIEFEDSEEAEELEETAAESERESSRTPQRSTGRTRESTTTPPSRRPNSNTSGSSSNVGSARPNRNNHRPTSAREESNNETDTSSDEREEERVDEEPVEEPREEEPVEETEPESETAAPEEPEEEIVAPETPREPEEDEPEDESEEESEEDTDTPADENDM